MKLEKCSACNGFVPPSVGSCPHCQTKRTTRIGAAAMVLGSGAIAFTLMACYGAAPCAERGTCQPAAPLPDTSGQPSMPVATPDGGK